MLANSKTAPADIGLSLRKNKSKILPGLAIGICLSFVTVDKAAAVGFSFSKVADTRSDFSDVSTGAAINDNGTVAFFATPLAGTRGIYTKANGAITEIVNRNRLPSLFGQDASSGSFDFSSLDINNKGTVGFLGGYSIGSAAFTGVFTSLGGSINPLATRLAQATGNVIGQFDLNNQDQTAYLTINVGRTSQGFDLDIAKLNQPDVNVATAFQSVSPIQFGTLASIGAFAINDQGEVTFSAERAPEDILRPVFRPAIFRGSGGELTTLADTNASKLDVNNTGDVVLSNSNNIRLFNNASKQLVTIADSSGSLRDFSTAAINNRGDIAFEAVSNTGGKGIFTGADPIANKIIGVGDSLLGSTITNLSFSREGLNNAGQIAFFAELADGTKGVFQASLTKPPKSVPEPTSIIGLLAFGSLGLKLRHRLKRSQP